MLGCDSIDGADIYSGFYIHYHDRTSKVRTHYIAHLPLTIFSVKKTCKPTDFIVISLTKTTAPVARSTAVLVLKKR